MLQSVMLDLEKEKFSEEHRKEIVRAIDTMYDKYDLNHDGLNFLEMYAASGGNIEEL